MTIELDTIDGYPPPNPERSALREMAARRLSAEQWEAVREGWNEPAAEIKLYGGVPGGGMSIELAREEIESRGSSGSTCSGFTAEALRERKNAERERLAAGSWREGGMAREFAFRLEVGDIFYTDLFPEHRGKPFSVIEVHAMASSISGWCVKGRALGEPDIVIDVDHTLIVRGRKKLPSP